MAKSDSDAVSSLLSELSAKARLTDAPILVHVVANGVRGDSRVIKSAQAAARQGFATLVLGMTGEDQPEALQVEGVSALLVPYYPQGEDLPQVARQWHRQAASIPLLRALRRIRSILNKHRPSLIPAEQRRNNWRGPTGREPRWASLSPAYLRINVAFAAALDALQPDVIHVQDTVPLPSAIAHEATRRVRGGKIRVLYDSHECVPELIKSFPDTPVYQAVAAIEQEYIRDADAVTTVSRQIAALVQKTYGLRRRPSVVTNAPSARRDLEAPDLRRVIGLPDGVPLAVYSGWIAQERGLSTVIRAMDRLPELHLAIVANNSGPATVSTMRVARVMGVADRVHFAPYVPPGQVTQYLSSATFGVIPRKPGGHLDLSLPTKFREFLHAGLPMVVSSNKAMNRAIKTTGVGEAFKAGSVAGLVRAITKVLADPDSYRGAITPELLNEHSWEAQAQTLSTVYAKLSGLTPRQEATVDFSGPLSQMLGDRYSSGAEAFRAVENTSLLAVKLGIGRANSAGQAYYWAESATTHIGVPAEAFGADRDMTHAPHRVVTRMGLDRARAAGELRRLLLGYSHLVIDGYESLLGGLLGDDIEQEIAALQRGGIQVALAAHGSDVRDPEAHMDRLPESYFRHVPQEWLELIGGIAARNREIAQAHQRDGGQLFVSTPDLLFDLPGATWLPVVVDLNNWAGLTPVSDRRVPRVLHRPSRSVPPIKGSEIIVPVLDKLHRQGVIEYLPDEGPVPATEMPALVERADIVIDQIRTGSYGVASVEAMAAGRVVIGNLGTEVRALISDEIPIVDGPPDQLERTLINLAEDTSQRLAIADQSRLYAAKWHSGHLSAQALLPFLES